MLDDSPREDRRLDDCGNNDCIIARILRWLGAKRENAGGCTFDARNSFSTTPTGTCVLERRRTKRGLRMRPAYWDKQSLLEAPWAVAMNDLVYSQTRGQLPPDFETLIHYARALIR